MNRRWRLAQFLSRAHQRGAYVTKEALQPAPLTGRTGKVIGKGASMNQIHKQPHFLRRETEQMFVPVMNNLHGSLSEFVMPWGWDVEACRPSNRSQRSPARSAGSRPLGTDSAASTTIAQASINRDASLAPRATITSSPHCVIRIGERNSATTLERWDSHCATAEPAVGPTLRFARGLITDRRPVEAWPAPQRLDMVWPVCGSTQSQVTKLLSPGLLW